ncbi:hypothetical protein ACFQ2B_31860 [Streptomyces stramineus]
MYEDSGERQFEIKLKGRRGDTVKHRQPLAGGTPRRAPAAGSSSPTPSTARTASTRPPSCTPP